MTGVGSINTTYLIAFQDKSSKSRVNEVYIKIPHKTEWKLFYEDMNINTKHVNKQAETNQGSLTVSNEERESSRVAFTKKYLLRNYARKWISFDQWIPTFKGWVIQFRSTDVLVKTKETYLPPITSKVTDFQTIHKYLTYLQRLAKSVNMPYITITLDFRVLQLTLIKLFGHTMRRTKMYSSVCGLLKYFMKEISWHIIEIWSNFVIQTFVLIILVLQKTKCLNFIG